MEELHLQLSQMKGALSVASDEDRPALESIIKDLEHLIGVSETAVPSNDNHPLESTITADPDDGELDEFSRFQVGSI